MDSLKYSREEEDGRGLVSEQKLSEYVRTFCSFGERLAGTPEERAACGYIVSQLKSFGLAPRVHEFEGFVSHPLEASLEVIAPAAASIPAIGVSFGKETPPEGITGLLADVGAGQPEDYDGKDVAGKIVLVDRLPRGPVAREALKHGCTGLVCRSKSHRQHRLTLSPVWGNPDTDTFNNIPFIPVVSVNSEDGRRLSELCREAEPLVTLRSGMDNRWMKLVLPEVEIPGRHPEFLLVGSHYCSWYEGATDNATGNAVLLELARIFALKADQLEFGIRFCWWPGHSQGRYAGSAWYADAFSLELRKNAIAYFNIDSPGVKGAAVYVPQDTMGELSSFAGKCVADLAEYSSLTTHKDVFNKRGRPGKYANVRRPNRSADQSFWGTGLSSISIFSMLPPDSPDYCDYASGCAGAWWWHSIDDTLDKFSPGVLGNDTRMFWTAMYRLCTSKALPYDFRETAGDFSGALREYDEAAGTIFNFAELKESLDAFLSKYEAFLEKLSSADDEEITALNRKHLQLCRLLIPVLYTNVDEFRQQPSVPSRLLPLLQDALLLSREGLDGFEKNLILTGLRKKYNKVLHAIVKAAELVSL